MDYSRLIVNDFKDLYSTAPHLCLQLNCKNCTCTLQKDRTFSDYCGHHKPKCQYCHQDTIWQETICYLCDKISTY